MSESDHDTMLVQCGGSISGLVLQSKRGVLCVYVYVCVCVSVCVIEELSVVLVYSSAGLQERITSSLFPFHSPALFLYLYLPLLLSYSLSFHMSLYLSISLFLSYSLSLSLSLPLCLSL